LDILITARRGVSMHFDSLALEIHEPNFSNARPRIERELYSSIEASRSFTNLDQEQDIWRAWMRFLVEIRAGS
jgi:hypothetical protein